MEDILHKFSMKIKATFVPSPGLTSATSTFEISRDGKTRLELYRQGRIARYVAVSYSNRADTAKDEIPEHGREAKEFD